MIIGIDIDDTIAKFAEKFKACAVQIDENSLGKRGVKDNTKFITKGMFYWNEEETKFANEKIIRKTIPLLRSIGGANRIIKLLKLAGHKIIFITARGFDGFSKRKLTVKWLKQNYFKYDKLITGQYDKVEVCRKEKIDLFIDDNRNICNRLYENGINVYRLLGETVFDLPTKEDVVPCVKSWKEIYDLVNKITNKNQMMTEYPIIFDTDTANEIDDQFALTYLLQHENIKLEAITIAPYFLLNFKDKDFSQTTEKSFQLVKEITKNIKPKFKNIYKGCEGFLDFDCNTETPAVNKIIEIAQKNILTNIVAIGAPTNIAAAIKKAPHIKNKIKVLWLGGNFVPGMENKEMNFAQDLAAVQTLIQENVDLTIFPVEPVTSKLVVSVNDLRSALKGKNLACDNLLKESLNFYKSKNIKYHSLFDIAPVAYLKYDAWFECEPFKIKINATNALLKHTNKKYGKNIVRVITHLDNDAIVCDMLSTITKKG